MCDERFRIQSALCDQPQYFLTIAAVYTAGLERDEVERLEDEADHLVAVFGSTGFREVFDEHIIESVSESPKSMSFT